MLATSGEPPAGDPTDLRFGDPGYHLLSGGRRRFQDSIGFRSPWRPWPAHFTPAGGIGGYVGAIAVLAAILLALPLLMLASAGVGGVYLCLLALFGAVPASDVAVAIVNRAVTSFFGATLLPALALRSGVPAPLRTLVAVPTLLTSLAGVEEQIERLEIHHLASPEGDLHFALLSDWTDAATQQAQGDEALLEAAAEGIERLNLRYGPRAGGSALHAASSSARLE